MHHRARLAQQPGRAEKLSEVVLSRLALDGQPRQREREDVDAGRANLREDSLARIRRDGRVELDLETESGAARSSGRLQRRKSVRQTETGDREPDFLHSSIIDEPLESASRFIGRSDAGGIVLSKSFRRFALVASLLLLLASPAPAAKRRLEIADLTADPPIAGRNVARLEWLPQGDSYSYVVRKGSGEEKTSELWIEEAGSGRKRLAIPASVLAIAAARIGSQRLRESGEVIAR